MSLTLEQVRRVAHLARIEVSEVADTQGVEPMAHAQDLAQRLRTDHVTEEDRRQAFQAIAPDTEAGLYLVPQVME
jgi:aspartyl-tRNA(Asn)/glutamyl-tRNA(Gln) amidotransferase subunit C